MLRSTKLYATLALSVSLTSAAAADTLEVPHQYPTIQAALTAAQPGDTVLVANGTWVGDGNRNLDFGGKAITLRSAGGPENCILDAQGSPTDPQRVLIFDDSETRSSRVEGFTITGWDTEPGAIADLFNGGGIQILGASPTLSNLRFIDNRCGCWGAAVYAGHGGTPLIENSVFINNFADDDGGAFFSWNSSAIDIRNSAFVNNGAGAGGGAIAIFGGGSPGLSTIVGSTFVDNYAQYGSAVIAYDTAIRNSIIWGTDSRASLVSNWSNTLTIDYSDVQGGYPGTGNLDVYPGLRGGYHLGATSPVINKGDPDTVVLPGELDIDGQPRVISGRIDMGADEWLAPFINKH